MSFDQGSVESALRDRLLKSGMGVSEFDNGLVLVSWNHDGRMVNVTLRIEEIRGLFDEEAGE